MPGRLRGRADREGGKDLTTVLSILGAILVISVLACAHELGHFLVAKKLGFGILEFAIGMGPVVWSKTKDGIQYSLRAFPIGGICRFEGEDEAAQSDTCFNAQPVYKRMLVVVAGPLMNVLLALFLSVITLFCYGDYLPGIVGFASEEAPAVRAGMQEGDILLSVDGRRIDYYADATDIIAKADSASCTVLVDRGGETVTLTLRDIYSQAEGRNMLGVTISPVRYHFGLWQSVSGSVRYVGSMAGTLFRWLGSIFTQGVQEGDVAGPVGTISIIGQAVRLGMETILRMTVLISINLAVINILPFPALDGGRLMFMLLEALRGKPIAPEREGMVHLIGFAMLMMLIVFLTYKDIARMFGG